MRLIKDTREMRAFSLGEREAGRSVGFVPTMGALHRGHIKLFERAGEVADRVTASIFVNPAQFGPAEDLDAYPRGLSADIEKAEGSGVAALFVPSVEDIYPPGFSTFVEVREVSEKLCGLSRPGHFRGVATVVLKLLNIVMPDSAVFGLKDYQQFVLIKKMASELNLGVDIVGVETVREDDGLALSSRNAYLSASERRSALLLPGSLELARGLVASGERESREIIGAVKKHIENDELAVIDYINVCDTATLMDIDRIEDEALLALAVKIGSTRLIDSVVLPAGPGRFSSASRVSRGH